MMDILWNSRVLGAMQAHACLTEEENQVMLDWAKGRSVANTYNDQKILELYKYVDGKFERVEHELCDQKVFNATQIGTISCIQGQIAQLQSLTKLVVPNSSVCPGWGNVTVTPAAATTA